MNIKRKPPEVFYKKAVLKKCISIHRKTPVLESLYNQVTGLHACNFIKKKFQPRYFSVNIAKFLKTSIFII